MQATFYNHRKISHKIGKCYECAVCAYRAPAPSTLKKHMAKHTRQKDHACDKCDYAASTVSQRYDKMRFNFCLNY